MVETKLVLGLGLVGDKFGVLGRTKSRKSKLVKTTPFYFDQVPTRRESGH